MREKQQFIKFTLFFATVYYRFQCSECHLVNVSGAVVFRFEKLNDNWLRFGREKEKPTWWQVGHFLHNHLNLVQQLAGSIQGLGHLVANSMRKNTLLEASLPLTPSPLPHL